MYTCLISRPRLIRSVGMCFSGPLRVNIHTALNIPLGISRFPDWTMIIPNGNMDAVVTHGFIKSSSTKVQWRYDLYLHMFDDSNAHEIHELKTDLLIINQRGFFRYTGPSAKWHLSS